VDGGGRRNISVTRRCEVFPYKMVMLPGLVVWRASCCLVCITQSQLQQLSTQPFLWVLSGYSQPTLLSFSTFHDQVSTLRLVLGNSLVSKDTSQLKSPDSTTNQPTSFSNIQNARPCRCPPGPEPHPSPPAGQLLPHEQPAVVRSFL
jgi:hypothetical protein